MIEHLILTSGGPHGIVQIGVLCAAEEFGILDTSLLKSIHGCSSGALIGALLCFKVPLKDMSEYAVSRNWSKCVHYTLDKFYETKGCVEPSIIHDIVVPFMKAYDIPLEITLKEFYELTHVEFDIMTTDVTDIRSVKLNHTTFPDLSLLTALTMSSAIPVIFPPVKYLGRYYMDGVYRRHCPMVDYPEEKTFIVYIDAAYSEEIPCLDDTSVYFQHIIGTSYRILTESSCIPKGIFIRCRDIPTPFSPEFWKRVLYQEEYRKELFEKGKMMFSTEIEKIDLSDVYKDA